MRSDRCRHGYEVDANGNHIIPKEKSTAELIEEAKRLLNKNKKEPEAPEAQQQTKPVNEIKRLSRLLEGY